LLERVDARAQADVFGKMLGASPAFSDQRQFTHDFKRLVGVSPGRFRTPARTA